MNYFVLILLFISAVAALPAPLSRPISLEDMEDEVFAPLSQDQITNKEKILVKRFSSFLPDFSTAQLSFSSVMQTVTSAMEFMGFDTSGLNLLQKLYNSAFATNHLLFKRRILNLIMQTCNFILRYLPVEPVQKNPQLYNFGEAFTNEDTEEEYNKQMVPNRISQLVDFATKKTEDREEDEELVLNGLVDVVTQKTIGPTEPTKSPFKPTQSGDFYLKTTKIGDEDEGILLNRIVKREYDPKLIFAYEAVQAEVKKRAKLAAEAELKKYTRLDLPSDKENRRIRYEASTRPDLQRRKEENVEDYIKELYRDLLSDDLDDGDYLDDGNYYRVRRDLETEEDKKLDEDLVDMLLELDDKIMTEVIRDVKNTIKKLDFVKSSNEDSIGTEEENIRRLSREENPKISSHGKIFSNTIEDIATTAMNDASEDNSEERDSSGSSENPPAQGTKERDENVSAEEEESASMPIVENMKIIRFEQREEESNDQFTKNIMRNRVDPKEETTIQVHKQDQMTIDKEENSETNTPTIIKEEEIVIAPAVLLKKESGTEMGNITKEEETVMSDTISKPTTTNVDPIEEQDTPINAVNKKEENATASTTEEDNQIKPATDPNKEEPKTDTRVNEEEKTAEGDDNKEENSTTVATEATETVRGVNQEEQITDTSINQNEETTAPTTETTANKEESRIIGNIKEVENASGEEIEELLVTEIPLETVMLDQKEEITATTESIEIHSNFEESTTAENAFEDRNVEENDTTSKITENGNSASETNFGTTVGNKEESTTTFAELIEEGNKNQQNIIEEEMATTHEENATTESQISDVDRKPSFKDVERFFSNVADNLLFDHKEETEKKYDLEDLMSNSSVHSQRPTGGENQEDVTNPSEENASEIEKKSVLADSELKKNTTTGSPLPSNSNKSIGAVAEDVGDKLIEDLEETNSLVTGNNEAASKQETFASVSGSGRVSGDEESRKDIPSQNELGNNLNEENESDSSMVIAGEEERRNNTTSEAEMGIPINKLTELDKNATATFADAIAEENAREEKKKSDEENDHIMAISKNSEELEALTTTKEDSEQNLTSVESEHVQKISSEDAKNEEKEGKRDGGVKEHIQVIPNTRKHKTENSHKMKSSQSSNKSESETFSKLHEVIEKLEKKIHEETDKSERKPLTLERFDTQIDDLFAAVETIVSAKKKKKQGATNVKEEIEENDVGEFHVRSRVISWENGDHSSEESPMRKVSAKQKEDLISWKSDEEKQYVKQEATTNEDGIDGSSEEKRVVSGEKQESNGSKESNERKEDSPSEESEEENNVSPIRDFAAEQQLAQSKLLAVQKQLATLKKSFLENSDAQHLLTGTSSPPETSARISKTTSSSSESFPHHRANSRNLKHSFVEIPNEEDYQSGESSNSEDFEDQNRRIHKDATEVHNFVKNHALGNERHHGHRLERSIEDHPMEDREDSKDSGPAAFSKGSSGKTAEETNISTDFSQAENPEEPIISEERQKLWKSQFRDIVKVSNNHRKDSNHENTFKNNARASLNSNDHHFEESTKHKKAQGFEDIANIEDLSGAASSLEYIPATLLKSSSSGDHSVTANNIKDVTGDLLEPSSREVSSELEVISGATLEPPADVEDELRASSELINPKDALLVPNNQLTRFEGNETPDLRDLSKAFLKPSNPEDVASLESLEPDQQLSGKEKLQHSKIDFRIENPHASDSNSFHDLGDLMKNVIANINDAGKFSVADFGPEKPKKHVQVVVHKSLILDGPEETQARRKRQLSTGIFSGAINRFRQLSPSFQGFSSVPNNPQRFPNYQQPTYQTYRQQSYDNQRFRIPLPQQGQGYYGEDKYPNFHHFRNLPCDDDYKATGSARNDFQGNRYENRGFYPSAVVSSADGSNAKVDASSSANGFISNFGHGNSFGLKNQGTSSTTPSPQTSEKPAESEDSPNADDGFFYTFNSLPHYSQTSVFADGSPNLEITEKDILNSLPTLEQLQAGNPEGANSPVDASVPNFASRLNSPPTFGQVQAANFQAPKIEDKPVPNFASGFNSLPTFGQIQTTNSQAPKIEDKPVPTFASGFNNLPTFGQLQTANFQTPKFEDKPVPTLASGFNSLPTFGQLQASNSQAPKIEDKPVPTFASRFNTLPTFGHPQASNSQASKDVETTVSSFASTSANAKLTAEDIFQRFPQPEKTPKDSINDLLLPIRESFNPVFTDKLNTSPKSEGIADALKLEPIFPGNVKLEENLNVLPTLVPDNLFKFKLRAGGEEEEAPTINPQLAFFPAASLDPKGDKFGLSSSNSKPGDIAVSTTEVPFVAPQNTFSNFPNFLDVPNHFVKSHKMQSSTLLGSKIGLENHAIPEADFSKFLNVPVKTHGTFNIDTIRKHATNLAQVEEFRQKFSQKPFKQGAPFETPSGAFVVSEKPQASVLPDLNQRANFGTQAEALPPKLGLPPFDQTTVFKSSQKDSETKLSTSQQDFALPNFAPNTVFVTKSAGNNFAEAYVPPKLDQQIKVASRDEFGSTNSANQGFVLPNFAQGTGFVSEAKVNVPQEKFEANTGSFIQQQSFEGSASKLTASNDEHFGTTEANRESFAPKTQTEASNFGANFNRYLDIYTVSPLEAPQTQAPIGPLKVENNALPNFGQGIHFQNPASKTTQVPARDTFVSQRFGFSPPTQENAEISIVNSKKEDKQQTVIFVQNNDDFRSKQILQTLKNLEDLKQNFAFNSNPNVVPAKGNFNAFLPEIVKSKQLPLRTSQSLAPKEENVNFLKKNNPNLQKRIKEAIGAPFKENGNFLKPWENNQNLKNEETLQIQLLQNRIKEETDANIPIVAPVKDHLNFQKPWDNKQNLKNEETLQILLLQNRLKEETDANIPIVAPVKENGNFLKSWENRQSLKDERMKNEENVQIQLLQNRLKVESDANIPLVAPAKGSDNFLKPWENKKKLKNEENVQIQLLQNQLRVESDANIPLVAPAKESDNFLKPWENKKNLKNEENVQLQLLQNQLKVESDANIPLVAPVKGNNNFLKSWENKKKLKNEENVQIQLLQNQLEVESDANIPLVAPVRGNDNFLKSWENKKKLKNEENVQIQLLQNQLEVESDANIPLVAPVRGNDNFLNSWENKQSLKNEENVQIKLLQNRLKVETDANIPIVAPVKENDNFLKPWEINQRLRNEETLQKQVLQNRLKEETNSNLPTFFKPWVVNQNLESEERFLQSATQEETGANVPVKSSTNTLRLKNEDKVEIAPLQNRIKEETDENLPIVAPVKENVNFLESWRNNQYLKNEENSKIFQNAVNLNINIEHNERPQVLKFDASMLADLRSKLTNALGEEITTNTPKITEGAGVVPKYNIGDAANNNEGKMKEETVTIDRGSNTLLDQQTFNQGIGNFISAQYTSSFLASQEEKTTGNVPPGVPQILEGTDVIPEPELGKAEAVHYKINLGPITGNEEIKTFKPRQNVGEEFPKIDIRQNFKDEDNNLDVPLFEERNVARFFDGGIREDPNPDYFAGDFSNYAINSGPTAIGDEERAQIVEGFEALSQTNDSDADVVHYEINLGSNPIPTRVEEEEVKKIEEIQPLDASNAANYEINLGFNKSDTQETSEIEEGVDLLPKTDFSDAEFVHYKINLGAAPSAIKNTTFGEVAKAGEEFLQQANQNSVKIEEQQHTFTSASSLDQKQNQTRIEEVLKKSEEMPKTEEFTTYTLHLGTENEDHKLGVVPKIAAGQEFAHTSGNSNEETSSLIQNALDLIGFHADTNGLGIQSGAAVKNTNRGDVFDYSESEEETTEPQRKWVLVDPGSRQYNKTKLSSAVVSFGLSDANGGTGEVEERRNEDILKLPNQAEGFGVEESVVAKNANFEEYRYYPPANSRYLLLQSNSEKSIPSQNQVSKSGEDNEEVRNLIQNYVYSKLKSNEAEKDTLITKQAADSGSFVATRASFEDNGSSDGAVSSRQSKTLKGTSSNQIDGSEKPARTKINQKFISTNTVSEKIDGGSKSKIKEFDRSTNLKTLQAPDFDETPFEETYKNPTHSVSNQNVASILDADEIDPGVLELAFSNFGKKIGVAEVEDGEKSEGVAGIPLETDVVSFYDKKPDVAYNSYGVPITP